MDEKEVIMANWSSGLGGGWMQPYCETCYTKMVNEYKERLKRQEEKSNKSKKKKHWW